jgi:hypothetical protein
MSHHCRTFRHTTRTVMLSLGAASAFAADPVAAQRPVQVPIERPRSLAGQPRQSITLPPGPPPAGLIVSGTPALARVTWGLVGASSYSVQRWLQSNPDCCRVSSPQLAASQTGWDDPTPWAGTYVYRATAVYSDGRQGFADVNYLRPEPTNPAQLTARQGLTGAKAGAWGTVYWIIPVTVTWSVVPGAAYYVLWGPGLPATGVQLKTTVSNGVETHQTSYAVSSLNNSSVPLGVTWGVNTWTVGAFFLPGPVSTPAANFTKGSVDIKQPAPKP